jgi:hypothetical protein
VLQQVAELRTMFNTVPKGVIDGQLGEKLWTSMSCRLEDLQTGFLSSSNPLSTATAGTTQIMLFL